MSLTVSAIGKRRAAVNKDDAAVNKDDAPEKVDVAWAFKAG